MTSSIPAAGGLMLKIMTPETLIAGLRNGEIAVDLRGHDIGQTPERVAQEACYIYATAQERRRAARLRPEAEQRLGIGYFNLVLSTPYAYGYAIMNAPWLPPTDACRNCHQVRYWVLAADGKSVCLGAQMRASIQDSHYLDFTSDCEGAEKAGA